MTRIIGMIIRPLQGEFAAEVLGLKLPVDDATSAKVASSTGSLRPSTSAANSPCSGRMIIPIILVMDLNQRIGAIAERLTPQLVELRKKLHQHPELAFE